MNGNFSKMFLEHNFDCLGQYWYFSW